MTVDEATNEPVYLRPYLTAARKHGAGFRSLLWASTTTQALRFDAISRAADLEGKALLDIGCGRADFLDFLLDRGVRPARYVGVEAVGPVADAAEAKAKVFGGGSRVVRADFVADPACLNVGADVAVISGSLNTAPDGPFYATLRAAYAAVGEALVFNFLASPMLAGQEYLVWRRPEDVLKFARSLGGTVGSLDDYIDGDMTVAVTKPGAGGSKTRS